jgi:hypothetical protein
MPPDVDDGSIADDADLLRRIRPDQIVDDKNLGARRPSSAAFKDPTMSVDTEPILHQHGLDWTFTLQGYSGYSLVQTETGQPRSHRGHWQENSRRRESSGRRLDLGSSGTSVMAFWAWGWLARALRRIVDAFGTAPVW